MNVAAALSFVQLVLSLSDDFAIISERAIAGCQNNRLDGRSDNVLSEDVGNFGKIIVGQILVSSSHSPLQSARGSVPSSFRAF